MKNVHTGFHPSRNRGLSLIEILVGLAIGLIGLLIMFQVFTASGERVRTTTSGTDAQIAGTLAMFQLDRDLRMAGWGIGDVGAAGGCSVEVHNGNGALAKPDFNFVLTPVKLIPNATLGGPVQIAVLYGNSSYVVTQRIYSNPSAFTKTLVSRGGFNLGDIVLVTDALGANCALVELTGPPPPMSDSVVVEHNQVTYKNSYSGANVAATMNAAAGTPALTVGGFAYNLGPTPSRNLWQVTPAGAANPNMLVWNNTLSSDTQLAVTEGIVNLQAEYGVDTSTSTPPTGIVDSWTSIAPIDWTKLLAVRIAILARSQQYEKTAVTTVPPFWANDYGPAAAQSINNGAGHKFLMFNVDGTADSAPGNANDWRHYRYKVYESTVPLLNPIWSK